MKTVKKHYVTFLSPGSFMAESQTKPIADWDIATALQMASEVVERYGAKPYGFRFETYREAAAPLEDEDGQALTVQPRHVKSSGMHYIKGQVQTVADVEAMNDPRDRILLSNMRGNGWDRIVRTTNGYQWCQPLRTGDKVLNADGQVTHEEP